MGRKKTKKTPQQIIRVSLDFDTGLLVKGWRRRGYKVSHMVRYAMKKTFPPIFTEVQEIIHLKAGIDLNYERLEIHQSRCLRANSALVQKIRTLKRKLESRKFKQEK